MLSNSLYSKDRSKFNTFRLVGLGINQSSNRSSLLLQHFNFLDINNAEEVGATLSRLDCDFQSEKLSAFYSVV